MESKTVIILGAGFGGLFAARHLAGTSLDVLLVDRHNYHTFFPLLYQVGAAELTPGEIAASIRNIFHGKQNIHFCLADVEQVDLEAKTIRTGDGTFPYDYLILALGSRPVFYGIPGAAEWSVPLKSMDQAMSIRNHILECFERAVHEGDPEQVRQLLTFAITGGGPTGVEFAGALSELIRGPLTKDFPNLKGKSRIELFEAGPTLLNGFSKSLGIYALKRLQKMGVKVHLNAAVDQVTEVSLHLKDGTTIPTRTVIWTAGVSGTPIVQDWGLPVDRHGQVKVLPTLQAPGHPEVYIAGDLAFVEQKGRPLPMIAQPAIQEGAWAARNILRQANGQAPVVFHYKDLGTLAVIGRNAAVADIMGLHLTGFIAWLIWASVHIWNLIGFRNRLIVLINWAADYFFSDRGIRLILPACLAEENVRILGSPTGAASWNTPNLELSSHKERNNE
jgi:NADH dehydrogenase